MNKASKITIIVLTVLVVLVSAASMTVSVWSTVSDISPRQLVRDLFRLNTPAGYDGKNLLDASSAREFGVNMYIYDAIELMPSTDYVLMPHAETLEAFGEGAMLILIFSNAIIADEDLESLDQIAFSGDEAAPDIEMLALYLLPFKFAFSTAAYPYSYLTVISGFDLSAEDTPLKLKIERGIEPTVWTSYGVGTTELYTPTPTAPTDEDPVPTPLAAGDEITGLYLNTTADGDAILSSIENAGEATGIYMLPEDYDEDTGAYASIVFVDLSEIQMLVLVKGPDDAQTIVPLWFSTSGFDLSALDLEGITTAGWQEAAQGDIAERYGLVGYEIQAVDGDTIKYSAWGDGDATAGKAIVDGIFSSTPFPGTN